MYPVVIKLPWSDCVKEKQFSFQNWTLPIPRKGETIRLFATYTGDISSEVLPLVVKNGKTLCVFHVEGVTYPADQFGPIEIRVSFVAPHIDG